MLTITLLMALFVVALSVPAFAQTAADDDYTPVDPGSGAVSRRASKGRLAYTGSEGTTSLVFIGLAGLAAGVVMVVGARRRSQVLIRT